MCQQACTLNEKCSRRNEKSKKHGSRPSTIMKNDKNRNISKFLKLIENINVSFSVSHAIDLWFWKIRMAEKRCSKFEKLNFEKVRKMRKGNDIIHAKKIKNLYFYRIATFWHVFGPGKLYEFSRRKPGWRFTAGLEFDNFSAIRFGWNCHEVV